RHRYAYMGIPYFHIDVFKRYFSMFRDACEAEGYDADPLQYGWLLPIYVAETDEQARREYEEHLWYFVKRLLPGITIQPPGYTSTRSLASILKSAGMFMLNIETWEQVVEGRYAIVGSPETVTGQLIDSLRELGAGNLLGLFQLGSLPDHLVRKNLALFAEQVMPKLRAEFPEGQSVYRPQTRVA
ncbi:MAG: LLM class flavin-dependent oxidoreductase, partial [Acidimicrobiia bacterium]